MAHPLGCSCTLPITAPGETCMQMWLGSHVQWVHLAKCDLCLAVPHVQEHQLPKLALQIPTGEPRLCLMLTMGPSKLCALLGILEGIACVTADAPRLSMHVYDMVLHSLLANTADHATALALVSCCHPHLSAHKGSTHVQTLLLKCLKLAKF